MLDDKNKKYVLSEFLRHLSHIQDKAYQRRIWIKNEGPECQAFDDAVCDFFDIGDPILENYKEYRITLEQYQILKNFRDQFEIFSDSHNYPEQFIDTPEWAEIMAMAKEVLKAFNYKRSKKKG